MSLSRNYGICVRTCRFREQDVDGDFLVEATNEDFDKNDFPKAKPAHWKKFWKKLDKVKNNGVTLQIPAQKAAVASPVTIASPLSASSSPLSTSAASQTKMNK